MMEFVRYSLRIEAPDPNFDTALQVVLDDLRKQVTASLKMEGQGLAIRNAHAKDYGVTRGEVEILANLPPEHAQGIYAKPDRHETMVRFLHEPVSDADRGRDGAVAGEPVAVRDRREAQPAAAGHRRRQQSREDGCDLNVAAARDRGAPAAGQHHARPQGSVPHVIDPAPPAQSSGPKEAEESRRGLRRGVAVKVYA